MPFKFALLCDLLSSLEKNKIAKATTAARNNDPDIRTVNQWFIQHERRIHHPDTDRLALLSCMFPERRTDRVYWLQATSLVRVIGRCLYLGSSRLADLDRWRVSGGPDLGQCVENVMQQAENHIQDHAEITVEEVDHALNLIASRCRFSGPSVYRQHTAVQVEEALAPLYRKLSSRDAKWLTRMILKDYSPVCLPQQYTLKRFHFLLPQLLQFQASFAGALDMLVSNPMNHFPPRPDPTLAATLTSLALQYLRPQMGFKIGRPEYYKARSIKHCHQMSQGRRMSIERKYDGEYCQIHIDLTNKKNPIQIFSKSGKDSTADRSGIIHVVEESLRIGHSDCKFSQRCIVEGELLVWSDKHGQFSNFHKLRRFLPRSGTLIGVENDSPPQPYEHLMIVFFDILLLDDDVCLAKPHRLRRLLLQDTIHLIPNRAAVSEQRVLDFGRPDSQHQLQVSFAKAIAQRWEGYVLKACEEPYFPMYSSGVDNAFGRWIKLKKDYIPGLGDTLDLVLLGTSYESRDAAALQHHGKLQWTHFFVGCLLNKEETLQSRKLPRFKVVDVIDRHCMHIQTMKILNEYGKFYACNPDSCQNFNFEYGHGNLPAISMLFKKPFVVEMMGSGFEKPSGARYFTLRFPRVLKVHMDRPFEDAASFRELQLAAEKSRAVPAEDLSQEREEWSKRLEVGSGLNQYIVRKSRSFSSASSSSAWRVYSPTPSRSSEVSNDANEFRYSLPRMEDEATKDDGFLHVSKENTAFAAVYIEKTTLPTLPDTSANKHILSENANLSMRQKHSQKESEPGAQSSKFGNWRAEKPTETQSSNHSNFSQATSLISVHQGQLQAQLDRGICVESTQATKRKRTPPVKSPLLTIPGYMPDNPSDQDFMTPQMNSFNAAHACNSSLHQFLESLGSAKTRSSLQFSNPYAEANDMAFGTVLLDTTSTPLGQELHKIGKALSDMLHSGSSFLPSNGRIFILDSRIIKLDIDAGDLRFCLRETWLNIAHGYYYACLMWGPERTYGQRSSDGHGPVESSRSQLKKHYFSREVRPALSVSFDKVEIAALGEYVSIEPLVHIQQKEYIRREYS
ncbi:hypothetical protein N7510_005019 [Penicillium lagena]|uniref:uncharacterized protein n=1 Tax=Penicillium lagena TaxID=94218 RepID=UPI0025406A3F|nr:uncharacterized protein N7510_005019 [Penicillium lagena]KAJ5621035.1 hypothetical protein N7510_005019 [Penicillium lagena]